MTTVPELRPGDPLHEGLTVVEASAGTGKTFTIAHQVARLVAVDGIPLEKILIVTFTRAATAELRDRIRRRFVVTARALVGDTPPEGLDEELAAVAAGDPATRVERRARAQAALTSFDRAQISTIHGFARRLLARLGFFARYGTDVEPDEVDDLLLDDVVADLLVGRYATRPGGSPVSRAEARTIADAVVGALDARIVPDPTAVDGVARERAELAGELRDETRRRLRHMDLATFDDALLEVRAALEHPEIGAAVRRLLRRRYVAAFVDESQDTDPIQWEVIRGIFEHGRLVVIGDPKQSIYAFRGADVETYLAAVAGADDRKTLSTNWRSDGPLVAALDLIFDDTTFGDPRIVHRPVRPAPGHEGARIDGVAAPLVIRRFDDDLDMPTTKAGLFPLVATRELVAGDVAAEVVRLLTGGVTIEAGDGARPVRPSDVAVLCRTRRQVEMVREQLGRRGVPSVTARTEGVFTAPAAEEWRRFLLGVEGADRPALVRLAASSVLVGRSPVELAALDEEGVLDLQLQMRGWKRIRDTDGVPALLAEVERATELPARLLGRDDGERLITDLRHIADELHLVWRRRRVSSLVAWLETTIADAGRRATAPDTRQRRLETDAQAVQVQTIHGAKGLQWPVVLVPYAWDAWSPKRPAVPIFHDPDGVLPAGRPRPRIVDAGGETAPGFADHQRRAMQESAAEEDRLLYVALTRPQHHLVVWWVGNTSKSGNSKLLELLPDTAAIDELAAHSHGAIGTVPVSLPPAEDVYEVDRPDPTGLAVATFDRPIDQTWRRASFTSLSPEHLLTAADTAEEPLRSDEPVAPPEEEAAAPPAPGVELPMAELPRGARFGTLVHHVLEDLPVDADDFAAAVRDVVVDRLRRDAWDLDAGAVAAAVVAAASTPLGPDDGAPRLRDLGPDTALHELTFELPVRPDAAPATLGGIGTILLDHLPEDDPYRGYAATLRDGPPNAFRGFLTGAIDLTTVLPFPDGDRYVVVDYKTNALPTRGDRPDAYDYAPSRLVEAMIDGNYVLQATLYQLALHRYLGWRLPGYDPHRHLGGAMYLFVRGMAGPSTPVVDGDRCGIARWRPPAEAILALDRYLAGEGP